VAVDVQAHFMPDAHREVLADHAARSPELTALTRPVLDAPPSSKLRRLDEARIAEMDAAGVRVQVLSLPPPGVNVGDRRERAAVAELVNDALLAAAGARPDRFLVLASLPLPFLEESLGELERLSALPLVRGVLVDATTTQWRLDDPAFDPLHRRLGELGWPLFLHPPMEPLPSAYADWALAHSVATMVATTLTALRLILSGTLDRAPELAVVVPHLGGTIPYLSQRISDLSGRGAAQHELEHYLRRRLLYDSCSFHLPALRCAIETVGAERIMLGSDYPFRGPLEACVNDIDAAGLPEAERRAILGGTAQRWFGAR
jgi:aminocarboxymuconate-semialdehyde decarboxylase